MLRVCALYPDLMNIYADRGNLLVLERRCRWRGLGFELSASGLGDPLDAGGHDLYYLGGGQDRDQRLCAEDLVENKREALHGAAARGALVLGVCGGYQLLGHAYTLGEEEIAGVGLLDVRTVRREGPRLIGNVAIEVSLEDAPRPAALPSGPPRPAADGVLAGFPVNSDALDAVTEMQRGIYVVALRESTSERTAARRRSSSSLRREPARISRSCWCRRTRWWRSHDACSRAVSSA